MNTNIDAYQLQQVYLDFKKIVDKYFSREAFSEQMFDSTDMAEAIEEMTSVCQKFSRQQEKDPKNESPTSNKDIM